MFCINCGKEVSENTAFCPYCGAKLDNAEQPVAEQPVEELTPAAEETPAVQEAPVTETPVAEQPAPVADAPVVEQPAPVVEQPSPVEAAAPVADTTPSPQPVAQPTVQPAAPTGGIPGTPAQANGKNKTLILIIILAVVVIIGVVVIGKTFIVSSDKTEPTTPTEPSTPTEPTTVADNTNTASYMGYTFTLPDGFTDKTDATYGLIISDGTVAYSIKVDFTNNYETYREALIAKYPTQAANLEKTVSGRKFLIGQVTDSQYKGSQYITEANDGETFIGVTLNKSNTIEYSDYQQLTTILDSSKKSGSNFAAGDANDPGANGPVSFNINRDAFGFEN